MLETRVIWLHTWCRLVVAQSQNCDWLVVDSRSWTTSWRIGERWNHNQIFLAFKDENVADVNYAPEYNHLIMKIHNFILTSFHFMCIAIHSSCPQGACWNLSQQLCKINNFRSHLYYLGQKSKGLCWGAPSPGVVDTGVCRLFREDPRAALDLH